MKIRNWSTLQRTTLVGIALAWMLTGGCVAYLFCSEGMSYFPGALLATTLTSLAITAAHLLLLKFFPAREACIGMLIGKVIAIPGTLSFGLVALGLVAMSADSGMDAAAGMAYITVPVGMLITAAPTTILSGVGAAIGAAYGRRKATQAVAP